MESPRHEIYTTYVGGRMLLSMLGKINCFCCYEHIWCEENNFLNCSVRQWLKSDAHFPLWSHGQARG
jgi:hypothetical protein